MSADIEFFLKKLQHPLIAGIDLSLDRMYRLLSLLRNPHKRLPPVIHVAGTNGKGSLIAYLHAIFEAAGYRVHRYTSPHLVHFNERILLAGKPIENAYLEKLFRHLTPALEQQQATFFEAITAAAFVAFAEKPADILLLETGLGGRLDATNVIDKPLLTVLTPISWDHTEYLGNSIANITSEKLGILKRGTPCIVGRQMDEVSELIKHKASELEVPLFRFAQEWKVENRHYVSRGRNIIVNPSLAGEHQYDNAATAVACIEQLAQFNISDDHINTGLSKAFWPARLQHLTAHPYTRLFPEHIELWLDGGHNQQGGEILGKWLEIQAKDKKIYLVCGMIKGKDIKSFLAPFIPFVEKLYTVTITNEATSQSADHVAAVACSIGITAEAASCVESALKQIAVSAQPNQPALACICGSLYLAGRVLEVA